MPGKFASIDEYIASVPEDVRIIVEEVRRTIRGVLPEAGEKISYQIPTFTLAGKNVVHFAAWKQHLAVYPIPAAEDALDRELEPYKTGKGTLRFPYDAPIPYDLIGRIAQRLADRMHDAAD